jgi:hypothetical protein
LDFKKSVSCHNVYDNIYHATNGIILGVVVNGRTHQYISYCWHDSYLNGNLHRTQVMSGGAVRVFYPFFISFLLCLPVFSQLPESGLSENNNYLPNPWNETIGSCDVDIKRSGTGESLMGNFVCDAMRKHTQADFAFISYGELYGDLYKGEITKLDMFRLIPFDRTLVVMQVSGDTLKHIMESTLGGISSGMAISGGKVEFDPDRPSQNRLTYVKIGDYSLYPQKIYRVVTIDYLANGNAGFDLLRGLAKTNIFRTGTLLRDILIDYIKQISPLDQSNVSTDNRWIMK